MKENCEENDTESKFSEVYHVRLNVKSLVLNQA
jgi:hypothetical protein